MSKKNYNEIEVKNNMKVENEEEVTATVSEKKDLKKVVSTQPKKVKKGLVSRLVTGVLGPEGLPSIGSYVNDEIVKPAIKNIIVDAVTSGINMIMYGEKGGPRTGGYGGGYRPNGYQPSNYRPRTNYTSQYNSQQPTPQTHYEPNIRPARYGVEDYIIADRYDAAQVLNTLVESADMYDSVSVADYYDLIGVPSKYTDNSYGWTIDSISRASVVPVRGGYVIKFPPVEVI